MLHEQVVLLLSKWCQLATINFFRGGQRISLLFQIRWQVCCVFTIAPLKIKMQSSWRKKCRIWEMKGANCTKCQLQRQLYSLSDASAPSPVALTTVVSVKKPDLSVLISVCAMKIARTSMLKVMMSMMKTKSNRKFHRNGQQNNVYRYSVRLSWLYI